MKMGDFVRVYAPNGPELVCTGVVICVAESGNSIAVTLLPEEQHHIYAHREGESAPWIDLETGEAIEIV